jgi:hypothetical protein
MDLWVVHWLLQAQACYKSSISLPQDKGQIGFDLKATK